MIYNKTNAKKFSKSFFVFIFMKINTFNENGASKNIYIPKISYADYI